LGEPVVPEVNISTASSSGASARTLRIARRFDAIFATEEAAFKAVRPVAVDDDHVLQRRQLGLERVRHRCVVVAAEHFGTTNTLAFAKPSM